MRFPVSSVVLMVLASPASLPAQTLYWDTNGSTAGSSNIRQTWSETAAQPFWSTSSDGTATPGTWAPGATAVFSAGTNATGSIFIDIVPALRGGDIVVEEGAVEFNGAFYNGSFRDLRSVNVAAGASANLNATLAQSGGAVNFTKYGPGPLTITAPNLMTGTMTFSGGTTNITSVNNLSSGTLTVNNGATLANAGIMELNNRTVQVDGVGSLFSSTGFIELGDIGNVVLNLSNGGSMTSGATLALGLNAGVTGTANISGAGSLMSSTTDLFLGFNGTGILSIGSGGRVEVGSVLRLGTNGGSSGVLNLNDGGTLAVRGDDGIIAGAGTSALNFAGGTLETTEAQFSTTLPITLGQGSVSTIDANGMTTLLGTVSGAGGLAKSGPGLLSLPIANTYSGGTTVHEGTLLIGNIDALGAETGNLTLNGGSLNLNTFSPTIGTVIFNGGSFFNGTLNQAAAYEVRAGSLAASLGGAAGLTKNGTGTFTLSGSNTFTGGTVINEGTLTLGSATALGSPAATLTINGGTLDLGGFTVTVGGFVNNGGSVINGTLNAPGYTLNSGSVSANLNGTNGITKAGPGEAGISGTNTHTGGIAISGGVLYAGSTASLGSGDINISTGSLTGTSNLSLDRNVTVSGANSELLTMGFLEIGSVGSGALTLSNGSDATSASTMALGVLEPAVGTALLTGEGTSASSGTDLILGYLGNGSMTIQNGASFSVGGRLRMAELGAASIGTLNLNPGGTLELNGSGGVTRGPGTAVIHLNGGILRVVGGNMTTNVPLHLSGAVTIDTGGYDVTFTGTISGTGGITKQGSGTLSLPGLNSPLGAITVEAGALELGSGANASSISRVGNNYVFNVSDSLAYSSIISGDSSVTKLGTGTLIFTANHTYSGGTTVSAGTIQIGTGGTTGNVAGNIDNNGTVILNRSGDYTFTGIISGSGGVEVEGFIQRFSQAQTYTGPTTVRSGAYLILPPTMDQALSASTSVEVEAGSFFDLSNRHLTISGLTGGGTVYSFGGENGAFTIDIEGEPKTFSGLLGGEHPNFSLTKSGAGTQILAADHNYTGATTVAAGILQIGNGGTTGSVIGNIVNNGNVTFHRSNDVILKYIISGSGSVTQQGSGSLIIAVPQSYTGPTSIVDGSLRVSHKQTTSTFSNPGLIHQPVTFEANPYPSPINAQGLPYVDSILRVTIHNLTHFEANHLRMLLVSPQGKSVILMNQNGRRADDATIVFDDDGAFLPASSSPMMLSGTYKPNGSILPIYGGLTANTNSLAGLTTDPPNGAWSLFVEDRFVGYGGEISGGWSLSHTAIFEGSLAGNISNNSSLIFDVDQEFTYAGTISGSGDLIKEGSGSLILTSNQSYAGGTTISQGTLQLGNGGTAGFVAGDITNNGNLTINRSDDLTFAGVISGSGSLTKAGTGTLTLLADSSYTGSTTISEGTLQLGNGGTTGSVTGNIVNNSSLMFHRSNDLSFAGVVSGSGSLTKAGAGTLSLLADCVYTGGTTISEGTLKLGNGGTAGSVTGNIINHGSLMFHRSDDLTFADAISGSGSLTKAGAGILTLLADCSYAGGTTISEGILKLGNGGTAGSVTGNIINHGSLMFHRSDDLSFAGTISGSGSLTKAGAGTLMLLADCVYTGGTTISEGTLKLGNGGTTGSVTGNIVNHGSLIFHRSDDLVFAGTISGTGSLTKTGTGILTLLADCSYTGGTTISEGVLQLGNGGTAGSVTGNIVNNSSLIFHRSDDLSFAGVISGTGGIIKLGSGKVSLPELSYSAAINLQEGTLEIGSGASASSIALTENNYVFNVSDQLHYSAAIVGQRSVTKIGDGLLIFSGNHTYTGGTTLSEGSIQIGDGGATGDLAGTIANNGTMIFNRSDDYTFTGVINGSGEVIADGYILRFSQRQMYSGPTKIRSGAYLVMPPNIDQALSSSTHVEVEAGGFFDLSNRSLTIAGLTGGGTVYSFGGANGALTIDIPEGESTFGGLLGDKYPFFPFFSLTKAGPGKWILTSTNIYTGGTTLSEGSIQIGDGGSTGDLTGTIANSGTMIFNRSDNYTFTGVINGSGEVIADGYILRFSQRQMYSGPTKVRSGAYLVMPPNIDQALSSSTHVDIEAGGFLDVSNRSLTIAALTGNGTVYSFGGSFGDLTIDLAEGESTFGGTLGSGSPNFSLGKAGAGKWILTAANTYTGGTTVSGGTLVAANSSGSAFGTGAVEVAGGTIGGTGSFTGALSIKSGGTVAPGASPGTLSSGSATLEGGGYLWELNDASGSAGTNWDVLAVNGTMTVHATAANPFTIKLNSLDAGNEPGEVPNFNSAASYTFPIATTTGGIEFGSGASLADSFEIDTNAFGNPFTGSWAVAIENNQLVLKYTPSPDIDNDGLADAWELQFFGSLATTNGIQDGDGDGLSALEEFAFGLNPTAKDRRGMNVVDATNFESGLPVLRRPPGGSDPFALRFVRRRTNLPGNLVYTPEFSTNLVDWAASTAEPVVISDAGGDYVVVEVPYPAVSGENSARQFGRVALSINQE